MAAQLRRGAIRLVICIGCRPLEELSRMGSTPILPRGGFGVKLDSNSSSSLLGVLLPSIRHVANKLQRTLCVPKTAKVTVTLVVKRCN
jgi:hypothetical protein